METLFLFLNLLSTLVLSGVFTVTAQAFFPGSAPTEELYSLSSQLDLLEDTMPTLLLLFRLNNSMGFLSSSLGLPASSYLHKMYG